ncbi:MAG: glycoside hydrolase family 27 protein [Acidobacteriota bacterium]|nr:glycoside hydrolase family 27 protein [Acidobacteriota bacterium]
MGDVEFVWDLKMDPATGKITGTQRGPFGDAPIVDGHMDGNKVELVIETESFGDISKVTATGTLEGDELHITPAMGGGRGRGRGGPGGAGPDGRGPMAGGPGGPPPGGRGRGRGFMSGPMIAKIGIPTPSYRAPAIKYATLPKVELPAPKEVASNGMAKTPPMGWNSWNKFRTKIDDKTVREIADAMVANGMKEAGYQYINIDDGWQWKRDESGQIMPNPNFPDMKALAAYVHSKGLRIGIYSSPGPTTCGGFIGSYGHEDQDARTFAEWGIDYLKYDWCSASRVWTDNDMRAAYQKMGEALEKSGRKIVYSLCQYGRANAGEWGPLAGGNLWRTTNDIRDSWQSMETIGFSQSDLAKFTRPGWWPDPDMLEVGNGGMTPVEYRTHLTLWAMIAAPLIAGNDIRNMTPEIKEILTNRDVIAVDQDKLGKGGQRIAQNGSSEVWAKPLEHGDYAVALFNRGEAQTEMSVKWSDLKLGDKVKVRDLWTHQNLGSVELGFTARVAPHGVVLIKVGR